MATLSELQAQRDEIISQMSAPLTVQYRERSLTHRSFADLEAALQKIDGEIAKLQSPQSGKFTIRTNRGLEI